MFKTSANYFLTHLSGKFKFSLFHTYIMKILIILSIVLIAGCIQTAQPTQPYQSVPQYGLLIQYINCNSEFLEVQIANLQSQTVNTEQLKLTLDNQTITCLNLPQSIAQFSYTRCKIPNVFSEDFHKLEVIDELTGNSASLNFTCGIIFQETNVTIISPIEEGKSYNVSEFFEWARTRNISLVGIKISANETYFNGFHPANESINLEEVSYWWEVEKGLKKVPDKVLQTMRNKTVYFSNKFGRGYTMATAFLNGTTAGFILEQTISERQTIHEFGHIVDFVGVKGQPGDPYNIFSNAISERNRIFSVTDPYNPNAPTTPIGFINVYSSANDQENFAEHFSYYILYANEFKERMKNDSLLMQKYNFFKNWIFEGKEY